MRPFARHKLAVAVSLAGGLGFIASASPSPPELDDAELASAQRLLEQADSDNPDNSRLGRSGAGPAGDAVPGTTMRRLLQPLRIGIGYQLYQTDLAAALHTLKLHPVAAVWLFAWRDQLQLQEWLEALGETQPAKTKVYVQVCTVAEGLHVARLTRRFAMEFGAERLVLVAQGADAGGHGHARSAGLLALLPEMRSALDAAGFSDVPLIGAGGVADARGAAAALAAGAAGVAMGTRFLAAAELEEEIPEGFREHVLAAEDGGVATVRTRLFDRLRGTDDFPAEYDGRALVNQSVRSEDPEEQLKADYQAALDGKERRYGPEGRLVSYAGTAVGLVKKVQPAAEIVAEVREGVKDVLAETVRMLAE